MTNQSGPPDRGNNPGDDTFDKFFGPGHEDPDRTDPGMPTAYAGQTAPAGYHQQPTQGGGYYPEPPREKRERSALMPLLVIGISLVVLAVVGWLVFRSGSSGSNAGPSQIPLATTSVTTDQSGSSSSSNGSSSTSNSSSSSTSTSSSSSAVSLPAAQSSCGSDTTFTTSAAVSCAFASRIYSTVQTSPPTDGQSSTFQVESLKSEGGSGLQYNVTCNHLTGSYIECVGVSSPDNGKRPTVYVMPSQN
ncbi:hypothetical protein [Calidifontibacter terrae]